MATLDLVARSLPGKRSEPRRHRHQRRTRSTIAGNVPEILGMLVIIEDTLCNDPHHAWKACSLRMRLRASLEYLTNLSDQKEGILYERALVL